MKIRFLGAARTVTGSCFLVKTKYKNFLVDCGMFQGVEFESRNNEKFDFDPHNIDFVLLTHSHLDHCGMLPKLFKHGFRGKVYMTPPTRGVVENMLLDSAKVQGYKFRESQDRANNSVGKSNSNTSLAYPIYNTRDVLGLLDTIDTVPFGKKIRISEDISFKFLQVGHALGASSIQISAEGKEILFSGDIGNSRSILDSNFDWPRKADYIVMESLYGGRNHESRDITERKLVEKINNTLGRNGNVLIPAFTYQRSQEMLYVLKTLINEGKISRDVRVYLDSPLAIRNTEIYKRHYKSLNPKVVKKVRSGEDLFSCRNFIFTKKGRDSKRINKKRGSIILAGHGMCVGGRIRHHLLHNLSDKRSSLFFVGFQAPSTL
jgi:metallo-beta-lactamase family protein